MMAPILLGESVYELYANTHFTNWGAFKRAIEERYGLSCKPILDAFYDMRPEAGESEAEFLLRVEDLRLKYS